MEHQITDRDGLKRYVSDNMPGNVDCYECSYEELLERATANLFGYLRSYTDWKYGDELPEIEDNIWLTFFDY